MSAGYFNTEDGDIVTLDSSSVDNAREGWVNIGTHAVQLSLDDDGNLKVEVCARTNEGNPIAVVAVTKEQSVEAGGRDPDGINEDEENEQAEGDGS